MNNHVAEPFRSLLNNFGRTPMYPKDWPKCHCGEPCMDGKGTCGRVECGPSTRRADAYGNVYETTPDEAARLDRIRAELFQSGDGYGGEHF